MFFYLFLFLFLFKNNNNTKKMKYPYTNRIHICFLSGVLSVLWLATVAYITYIGKYDFHYFSYWGYTLFGIYNIAIFIATVFNLPRLMLFICLFIQPLAQGTCIIIVIIISIIVRHAPNLVNQVISDRPLTPQFFSAIRDGDWLIHGFTAIGILFLCAVGGFNQYVNRVLFIFFKTHNAFVNVLLCIWWIFTPIFLIGAYTLCGNWAPDQYGTDLPVLLSFSETFIVTIVVQIPCFLYTRICYTRDDMKFVATFSDVHVSPRPIEGSKKFYNRYSVSSSSDSETPTLIDDFKF